MKNESQHHIVLTGYAAITTQGTFSSRDKSTFATPLRERPLSDAKEQLSATNTIPHFDIKNYPVSPKTYLDRCSALALAAAALALQDAGIMHPPDDPRRFGITLGTHYGCMETMKKFCDHVAERGVNHANALLFSHSYLNSPISLCAIEFDLQGYHNTVCANSQGGLEAVRLAYDAIAVGHADAMLCGGVDAMTAARAEMDPTNQASEAGVFFVLEKRNSAQKRGAKVLLEMDETIFASDLSDGAKSGNGSAADSALELLAGISHLA